MDPVTLILLVIALSAPAVILALLIRLDRAEVERDEWREIAHELRDRL